MDKSTLNLATLENFRQKLKKSPIEVVFAKNSALNTKGKIFDNKKPPESKKKQHNFNSTYTSFEDHNLSILSASNLLNEVQDIIIEDQFRERDMTTSQMNSINHDSKDALNIN